MPPVDSPNLVSRREGTRAPRSHEASADDEDRGLDAAGDDIERGERWKAHLRLCRVCGLHREPNARLSMAEGSVRLRAESGRV